MAARGDDTRQALIDSAARLFSTRGINTVSLEEIVKASGQRNNAALYYHFGNRQGILAAILARHVEGIRGRRQELLNQASASDPVAGLPSLVEAYVRPVAELASGSWRDRAYLQISAEVVSDPGRTPTEVIDLLGDAGGETVMLAIAGACSALPDRIRVERLQLLASFSARACADLARQLQRKARRRRELLSDEEFVQNLIDMFQAALQAPATGAKRHEFQPIHATR